MTKAIITINGRTYDAITGMPVAHALQQLQAVRHTGQVSNKPQGSAHKPLRAMADVAPTRAHAPAQAVHQIAQKSHTLYRKALTKPLPSKHATQRQSTPTQIATQPAQPRTEPVVASQPQRSPLIRKFSGSHPEAANTYTSHAAEPIERIAPAAVHPAVAKALQQRHATTPQPSLSGSDLKEQLIKERLSEVGERPPHPEKKTSWLSRQPRLVTILSSTLALLILGGYLTYITLPSISLRVAASRAGVNANMPEYKPDGYSLDGPITYSPGEVVISYKSNTNDESGYKLVQKATNWDSQAVLDNYVTKLTDNYLTFQERGITVYTFNNKAAWVNGGLLYTIDGNAALSSDQILKVASSI